MWHTVSIPSCSQIKTSSLVFQNKAVWQWCVRSCLIREGKRKAIMLQLNLESIYIFYELECTELLLFIHKASAFVPGDPHDAGKNRRQIWISYFAMLGTMLSSAIWCQAGFSAHSNSERRWLSLPSDHTGFYPPKLLLSKLLLWAEGQSWETPRLKFLKPFILQLSFCIQNCLRNCIMLSYSKGSPQNFGTWSQAKTFLS